MGQKKEKAKAAKKETKEAKKAAAEKPISLWEKHAQKFEEEQKKKKKEPLKISERFKFWSTAVVMITSFLLSYHYLKDLQSKGQF